VSGIGERLEARLRDRGLAPWTGRAEALARLASAYQEMWAGRGSLVTIEGDAGVGKSRLCHEFLSRVDSEVVAIYAGRCQSYGSVTP
jgi:adenylate cyclase